MSRSAAEPARLVYDSIPSAVLVLGRGGHILHANRAAEILLGLPVAKMRAKRPDDLWQITSDDGTPLGPGEQLGVIAIDSGAPEQGVLRRIRTTDGTWLSVQIDAIPSVGADGKPYQAVCTLTDVTARRRSEAYIRQEEREWRQLFQKAGTGMARLSMDGRVIRANDTLHQLLGYTPPRLHGRRLTDLVHPDDAANLSLTVLAEFDLGRSESEVRYLRADGTPVWVRSVLSLVRDGHDSTTFVINTVEDITERKAREAELESRAVRDAVTGLPNRVVLQDRLLQAVRASQRDGTQFVLLLVDLDNFKKVNDTFGHQVGDRLLMEAADRLRACVREADTVTRVGGDEFAVVLVGAGDAAGAGAAAAKIADALNEAYVIDGADFPVGASVGAACFPDHGQDAEALFRSADVAMYAAKRTRAGFAMFSEDDESAAGAPAALVTELRAAITGNQLVLHFQPQVDLHSGAVKGVEALVRWRHPVHGLLMPDRFLGAAEISGLISELELWVVDEALRSCRAWRDEGLELWVAVNVSGRSLQDAGFADRVCALLEKHGLDPTFLQVEIMQSALAADQDTVAAAIGRLAAIGLRVGLDDFGVGRASLELARRLPVDELKIDRSFVVQLARSPQDAAVVESIAELGRNLGVRVVALGVEDERTADLLQEAGCELAQGFFVGRPCPADEVPARARDTEHVSSHRSHGSRRAAISFDEVNRRLHVLEPVSLFMSLPPEQLRRLARQMTETVVPAGELLSVPGELATSLQVIAEGVCEVFVEGEGRERSIARLGRGDFVGTSVVAGGASAAGVRATADCQVLRVEAGVLQAVVGVAGPLLDEVRQVAEQRRAMIADLAATALRRDPGQAGLIAVYSPKGGAGKTTLAVNLAATLARRWPQDVLLIDLALPYNHAALVTKLSATTCLARLAGAADQDFDMLMRNAIIRHPANFTVLSTALRPEEADLITPDLLLRAIAFAKSRYRYIVFDLGVALSDPVLTVLEASDHVALVLTPELTSMKDAKQFLDILGNVLRIPSDHAHVIVNHRSGHSGMTSSDIEQVLGQPVDFEVAHDGVRPERAAMKGELLALNQQRSGIGRAMTELAATIERLRPVPVTELRSEVPGQPGWFGYALS